MSFEKIRHKNMSKMVYLRFQPKQKKKPENRCNSTSSGLCAEKEGFEPSLRLSHTTPLAGDNKPLKNKHLHLF